MTRLLLVDDHAVVRSGLKMLLSGHEEMEIVGNGAVEGVVELLCE